MNNNVIAIATLYKPDESVVENMKILSGQVDTIILCDNSPEKSDAFCGISNCIYVFNDGVNLGLSAAFNKVLTNYDIYSWKDSDLIIFFDQDSRIKKGYIYTIVQEYFNIRKIDENAGCVGPVFFNASNDLVETPHIKSQITENSFRVNNVITSSMLVRYSALKAVDFWNEKIFLDLADWELCWRLNKQGHQTYITKAVVLDHAVGFGDKKLGPLHIGIGAPIREYYQTREALYLMRKRYVPLKMRVRLWVNVYLRPLVHKLFLPDWDARKHYIERGREDYKKNIKGAYIP